MNKFVVVSFAVLVFALAIYSASGACCTSDRGYCKDCSKAGWWKWGRSRQKCCGVGSGSRNGNGCNIFCCRCICRRGLARISSVKTWWFRKNYYCTLAKKGDDEFDTGVESLRNTWETFNAYDMDENVVLDADEFLSALERLLDENHPQLVHREEEEDEILEYAESAGEDQLDFALNELAKKEFREMDQNEDGLIQPEEFDADLQ